MPDTELNELNHTNKKDLNIFKMFISPKEEFQKLKGEYSLIRPVLILMVLLLFFTMLLAVVMESGDITAISGIMIFGVLFSFIGICIGFLFAGVILWGIAHIFGGNIGFKQAVSIQILTSIIGVLGGVINTLIAVIFSLNVEGQYTGLGGLVAQENPVWAFLSVLDIFTIWTGILVALGIKIVTSLSWGKSIVVMLLTILIPAFFSFIINTILSGMPV